MDFRRINSLPPYVFTIIDTLKIEARRAGEDVIDLGFGNPDLPSPDVAVDKLCEAARNPRNHRYSSSRGLPNLRQAVADLYLRRFGVVARRRAFGPPTTGSSIEVAPSSTVSSVPGFGQRVKSLSLEKIMSPIRCPAGITWSSGWKSKLSS